MPMIMRRRVCRLPALLFGLSVVCLPWLGLSDYINPKSGAYYVLSVDLTFGEEDQLRLERYYSNRTLFDGLLGPGWCSTLEDVLEPVPKEEHPKGSTGSIWYVACGAAEGIILDPVGPGTYRAPGYGTLQKKGDLFVLSFDARPPIEMPGCPACPLGLLRPLGTAIFDKEGRLLRRSSPTGSTWTFHYEGDLLQWLRDSHGHEMQLSYYSNGKLREVRGNNGSRSRYGYDFKGQLSWVELPNGQTCSYQYNQFSNLTRAQFPDRSFEEIRYDPYPDYALSIRLRDQRVVNYDYRYSVRNERRHIWTDVMELRGTAVERSRFEEYFGAYWSLERTIEISGDTIRDIEWDRRRLPRSITSNGLRRVFRPAGEGGVVRNAPIQNLSAPGIQVREVKPGAANNN